MSQSVILKRIPGCGSSAVEKTNFRRFCSIITQKEYDYSLPAVHRVQFCSRLFDCERYSKAKNHTAEQSQSKLSKLK